MYHICNDGSAIMRYVVYLGDSLVAVDARTFSSSFLFDDFFFFSCHFCLFVLMFVLVFRAQAV